MIDPAKEQKSELKKHPRSQKRDLHPTDEDLSVGTPDLGHPYLRKFLPFP
jgi:hypothetical protein